jgi:hypothetical protein
MWDWNFHQHDNAQMDVFPVKLSGCESAIDRASGIKPSWDDVRFGRFRVGRQRRDPCPRMQSVSEKRLFSAKRAETVETSTVSPTNCSHFRKKARNPVPGRTGP